jgi:hypothetical protein
MNPKTTRFLAWLSLVLGIIPLAGLLLGIAFFSNYSSMAPLLIEHTRMGILYLIVFGGPFAMWVSLVTGILVGRYGNIKTQAPPVIIGFLASLGALLWYAVMK